METPVHNWASNGADAFRQFAQGYKPVSVPKLLRPQTMVGGWMR